MEKTNPVLILTKCVLHTCEASVLQQAPRERAACCHRSLRPWLWPHVPRGPAHRGPASARQVAFAFSALPAAPPRSLLTPPRQEMGAPQPEEGTTQQQH